MTDGVDRLLEENDAAGVCITGPDAEDVHLVGVDRPMSDDEVEETFGSLNAPGVGIGITNGIDDSARFEPHIRTTCDHPACTKDSLLGQDYCRMHSQSRGIFDPPATEKTVIREQVSDDVEERLIRVEAKLDALLAALDVSVEGDGEADS